MLDGRDNPAKSNWVTVKAEADAQAITRSTQQAPTPQMRTAPCDTKTLVSSLTSIERPKRVAGLRTTIDPFLDGEGTVT
ncbi:MAG: hypothetical protein IPL93_15270 [Actinomycetales bacterium]|nr:hypothetical protein [Actinomycetales bacterium]